MLLVYIVRYGGSNLKIALESLGCSKNLVDAEIMLGLLNKNGHQLVGDYNDADIVIVNTCGFIESANRLYCPVC